MSRQWSSDESYRPPLGNNPTLPVRQPSLGATPHGSAFGQGFGQPPPTMPPPSRFTPSSTSLPQHGQHQQFMPTHYSSGVVGATQGLTQRTPSVGGYPSHQQQQQHPHHNQPAVQTGSSYVPAPSFSPAVGFHESCARGSTPASMPSSSPTHSGGGGATHRFGFPEDDLPLLDELGIHPSHIKGKAIAVLHPLGRMREEAINDPDLAGPFVFAVLLGFLLSLQGKVQFSAIYGLSSLGMFGFRILIGLMSDEDVRILHIISTLGYCLLPNLILASIQTVLWWATGSHTLALPFAAVTITWSAWCACHMFAKLFGMESQRFLLLYPLAVFYSMFAALTIF